MQTTQKRWNIKEKGNEEDVDKMAEALKVDKNVANLLVQRGMKTYEEAEAFFRPHLADLHDPFMMKDMDKAVERLHQGIENKEKILVYGDYDVDGTTSVALLYSFLRGRTDNIDYYIPDRHTEGYGISKEGIDYAADNNCSLVIALDCGIKANEKIEYANSKNIDFIICDHHTPGESLPDAIAILDPKRDDCEYPFKELSGCGVGFKLLQAYSKTLNLEEDEEYKIASELIPYLDLVVVSIASDIVPIVGENRILAYYGIRQLNESPRTGLASIIELAGIQNKEIEINDIVFKIGPRINAAGRIESGQKSVELLISDDRDNANLISSEVDELNQTRKDIDAQITEEALKLIEDNEELINRKSTVLYNPEWHKGVVGIVASRLIEHYYKPTIVLTKSNGLITGSARSVAGFDIYNAIDKCNELLENFGGHKFAAGLSMKPENVETFIEKFEKVVSETITPEALIQQIDVDSFLRLNNITPKFYRILKQFSPFGPENMKPVFVTNNVIDRGTGRIVGKERDHLKMDLKENVRTSQFYSAIAFKQANHFHKIKYRKSFNICYSVEENEFMGKVSLQIKVRDIKEGKNNNRDNRDNRPEYRPNPRRD